jgi:hypothetical protein
VPARRQAPAAELFGEFGWPDVRRVERALGGRRGKTFSKLHACSQGLLALAGQVPRVDALHPPERFGVPGV